MCSEIPVSDYASRKLNLRHSHKRDEVVMHEEQGWLLYDGHEEQE